MPTSSRDESLKAKVVQFLMNDQKRRGGYVDSTVYSEVRSRVEQMSPDELNFLANRSRGGPDMFEGNVWRDSIPYIGGLGRNDIRKMNVDDWQDTFSNAMETFTSIPTRELEAKNNLIVESGNTIKELTETLENIKKEPLILYSIDRLSKDSKFAFVKKNGLDLRIQAVKDLEYGDEVLLHPKTFQIVERLGPPPLQLPRFALDQAPDITWDDIGGQEQAKADMIEAIEMPHKNKKLFKHYNKRQMKGILLSGPPGCGKTMLGRAAAGSLSRLHDKDSVKSGFLYVKGPEVLDCYVGQSEKIIRDMFFDAQRHYDEFKYPAVIFLDEADALLAARGSRNVGIGNTIVPMFLTEMDGLEESSAIVIIATNMPEVLDPAIVRDGRIDRKVTVSRPDQEMCKIILGLYLRKVPLGSDMDIDELSMSMAGSIFDKDRRIKQGLNLSDIVNGAMLANCVNIAASYAMRRDVENKTMTGITLDDCMLAIHRIQQQSALVSHSL